MAAPTNRNRGDQVVHFDDVPARTSLPGWCPELLDSVSAHSQRPRRAVRAAHTELLHTCWSIGREVLERQRQEGWSAKGIDHTSADLKSRFSDACRHSPRNLKYMLALAACRSDGSMAQRCAAQLPWRHHQYLLDKPAAVPDDEPAKEAT